MLVKFKNKIGPGQLMAATCMYIVAIFADFVAPYGINTRFPDLVYATPTRIHIRDVQGNYHAPFIYPRVSQLDEKTYIYNFIDDTSQRVPIQFFMKGEPYKLLGLIPGDVHLFGVQVLRPCCC
jgi:peptide/nickel transport system permease protein